RGLGAGRQDDVFAFQLAEAVAVGDADLMRASKGAEAMNQIDAVALELVLDDGDFAFDDALNAKAEIRHSHLIFGVVVRAVKTLLVEAGEMEHGFTHRFAGNGAGVGADATDSSLLFDERDTLSGFYSLNGGALPPGTRTNHNEFIRLHSWIPG